jgi:hypothetical protein
MRSLAEETTGRVMGWDKPVPEGTNKEFREVVKEVSRKLMSLYLRSPGHFLNFHFIHLWAIYIFPGSVHLFFCSQIGRPMWWEYINRSQIYECRNWD